MMDNQKFCLKWDGFQTSVTSLFDCLRQDGELVDITLCCEGQQVQAHRMMLSACSPYFRDLLKNNKCQQMVIFLKDTSAADLHAIIEFMYKGSVNVAQSQLASFIKTAEMLQIRGLSGDDDKAAPPPAPPIAPPRPPPEPRLQPPQPATPPAKRRCTSGSPVPLAGPTVWPLPPPQPQQQQQQQQQQPPPPPPPPPPPQAAQPPPPPPRRPDTPVLLSGSSNQSAPSPADVTSPAPEALLQQQQDAIKVEKVDLTDEEDVSLDATLGRLAEFEGGYPGEAAPHNSHHEPDLSMLPLPGPSQRLVDDGSTPGGRMVFVCSVCCRRYSNKQALTHHMKMHQGLTTCCICGKVLCIVAHLRRHLAQMHNLTPEQVRHFMPTLPKGGEGWPRAAAAAMARPAGVFVSPAAAIPAAVSSDAARQSAAPTDALRDVGPLQEYSRPVSMAESDVPQQNSGERDARPESREQVSQSGEQVSQQPGVQSPHQTAPDERFPDRI